MKSLKARFKKADVSAIPGNVGTRGPALGCSQGREDLGISPTMPPVSQGPALGHGVVTHPKDSSPTEVGIATLADGIEPPVCPQCSQSHRGEWGRAKEREAGPRSPPCPLPGTSAGLPAATARGTSLSMLLNYSASAWHGAAEGRGGQRCPQCTGGDRAGDMGTQVEAPHLESGGPPCWGCSVPQFTHIALDTSLRGSRCPAATETARTAPGDTLRFGVPP